MEQCGDKTSKTKNINENVKTSNYEKVERWWEKERINDKEVDEGKEIKKE